jgi:FkbM family methyltransferase
MGWQFRKLIDLFPYDLKVNAINVRIADRTVANGPGALLNAMGYYDPNNMYFLEELFKKKILATFFDIGANIGIYSLIPAWTKNGKVVAFEPHPYTYNLLQENISLNSLEEYVVSIQAALGEENGEVKFTDNAGSPINHIIDKNNHVLPTVSVKIIRGDTFCNERDITPDVLKIDVEGYENCVLRGFGSILKDVKVIIVECKTLDETCRILCDQYGFWGPFKLDYHARSFVRGNISYEDWIFVSPQAIHMFENEIYSFEDVVVVSKNDTLVR